MLPCALRWISVALQRNRQTFDPIVGYSTEHATLTSLREKEAQSKRSRANTAYSVARVVYKNGTVDAYSSHFEPLPELVRPDADLYLISLLPNGMIFKEKSADNWYRATRPGGLGCCYC